MTSPSRCLAHSLSLAFSLASLAIGAPALAQDGDTQAWAWGRNDHGSVGDGTSTDRALPVEVLGPLEDLTAVAAGSLHSLALDVDGEVWAWGRNVFGMLGDGTTTTRHAPVGVALPPEVRIVDIGAGGDHSFAVDEVGAVWAWGLNSNGQLGDGTLTLRSQPVAIGLPPDTRMAAVTGGLRHSLALSDDGRVWAWGDNRLGQIGDGTTISRRTPVPVSLPDGLAFTDIAAGNSFSLAVSDEGTVWAWGVNASGRLGDGTTTERHTPVQVRAPGWEPGDPDAFLEGITAVTAGHTFAVALGADGTVWAWGSNADGWLGDGTATNRLTPVQVRAPGWTSGDPDAFLEDIVAVAAGSAHVLAVDGEGALWSWGWSGNGRLGTGGPNSRTPVRVTGGDAPLGPVSAAAAGDHSLVLASPIPSEPPTAVILRVDPQPVHRGRTIVLDGLESYAENADSEALTYTWSLAPAPESAATLETPDPDSPWRVEFLVDALGDYLVELVVTDPTTELSSSPAELTISSHNQTPIAELGAHQAVFVGQSAVLDGSGSYDPDGDAITLTWDLAVPPGSAASLEVDEAQATLLPDLPGTYVVGLTVRDGPGAEARAESTLVAIDPADFASGLLLDAIELVNALPRESVSTTGNQRALVNWLTQAIEALQAGDLGEADHKARLALRRTDGWIERGSVDLEGRDRDWITDPEAQDALYHALLDALDALTFL